MTETRSYCQIACLPRQKMSFIKKLYTIFLLVSFHFHLRLSLAWHNKKLTFSFSSYAPYMFIVLPESPVVLDRWGRQLNSTKIGPMQEGEDIILSCRVVGGKLDEKMQIYIHRLKSYIQHYYARWLLLVPLLFLFLLLLGASRCNEPFEKKNRREKMKFFGVQLEWKSFSYFA